MVYVGRTPPTTKTERDTVNIDFLGEPL